MASLRRAQVLQLAELLEVDVPAGAGNVALMELVIGAAEESTAAIGEFVDDDDQEDEALEDERPAFVPHLRALPAPSRHRAGGNGGRMLGRSRAQWEADQADQERARQAREARDLPGPRDERAERELGRLSPAKLDEPWSDRAAQKQVLSNILYGRGFSRDQRRAIAAEMAGRSLRDLAQVVARFEPAEAEPAVAQLADAGGDVADEAPELAPEAEQQDEPEPEPEVEPAQAFALAPLEPKKRRARRS